MTELLEAGYSALWIVFAALVVVALMVGQLVVMVLISTSPLTWACALIGSVPWRGRLVRLGPAGRTLVALPAVGTIVGLALHAAVGGGSWWNFAAGLSLFGAVTFAARPGRRLVSALLARLRKERY